MQPIEEIYRARLALLLNEAGSQRALAARTGKSVVQLSQWLHAPPDTRTGKPRVMSRQSARQLEQAMGKPEGWMDQPVEPLTFSFHSDAPGGQSQFQMTRGVDSMADLVSPPAPGDLASNRQTSSDDYVEVPYVRFKLSAGAHGFAVEYLNGTREPLWFRRAWFRSRSLNPRKVFACDIGGPSMLPGLEDGDTVLVNTEATEPRDGKVFAAVYEGEMVVKRLRRNAGEWWLASDNPDQVRYAPKLCDANCRIVGQVVHKQSETI